MLNRISLTLGCALLSGCVSALSQEPVAADAPIAEGYIYKGARFATFFTGEIRPDEPPRFDRCTSLIMNDDQYRRLNPSLPYKVYGRYVTIPDPLEGPARASAEGRSFQLYCRAETEENRAIFVEEIIRADRP